MFAPASRFKTFSIPSESLTYNVNDVIADDGGDLLNVTSSENSLGTGMKSGKV